MNGKPVILPLAAAIIASVLHTSEASTHEACTASVKDLFDNPTEVKLSTDHKSLYVADTDNDRVVVVDPKTLVFLAEFGDGELDGVRDIDTDRSGRLYAADTHNNRIAIYDLRKNPPTLTGELKGGISRPESVLIHPNNDVFVSALWSRNIVVFRDGKKFAELEDLSAPRALALSFDKAIWVADASKNQFLHLNSSLKIEGVTDGQTFGVQSPTDIEFMDGELLIVSEKYRHQISIIAFGGGPTHVIGGGKADDLDGMLRRPNGIEVEKGTLWVADSGNNRVLRCELNRMPG